jgi:hypothetical protein
MDTAVNERLIAAFEFLATVRPEKQLSPDELYFVRLAERVIEQQENGVTQ